MKQGNRLDVLSSLKGIFILLITFHNTMLVQPLFEAVPGSAFITLFGGALGDSMFFIVSGFCMSYGYRDRIMAHAVSFSDYLRKRLIKLYPMYLLSNLAAIVLAVVQYGMSAIVLKKLVLTLLLQMGGGLETGTPYNSPTWFLSTLFVCYIAFFFLAHHAKTKTNYCCAIIGGIIWGYALMVADVKIPCLYRETGIGLMNFFIGCTLAEVYPLINQETRKWVTPASFFVLLSSLYLLLKYGVKIICGDVGTAFAFWICPLILYLALADGLCSKILRWKPFVHLGKISSSIFFWHFVVYSAFALAFSLIAPGKAIQEGHYLIYVVVMISWSLLSHYLHERVQKSHTMQRSAS